MSALGAKSEAALRAAMARLLDGRPERTDGALTVSNLARVTGGPPRGSSRSASAHSKPSCAPCAAPRSPTCAASSARSPSTSRC